MVSPGGLWYLREFRRALVFVHGRLCSMIVGDRNGSISGPPRPANYPGIEQLGIWFVCRRC